MYDYAFFQPVSIQLLAILKKRMLAVENGEFDKQVAAITSATKEEKEMEQAEKDYLKTFRQYREYVEQKAELNPESSEDMEIVKLKREKESLDKRMRDEKLRKSKYENATNVQL